jgi:hypothetical protein
MLNIQVHRSTGLSKKTVVQEFVKNHFSHISRHHIDITINGEKRVHHRIFAAIVISILVSSFALAIVHGSVSSTQAIHMSGSIVYPSPSPIPTPSPTANNLAPIALYPDGAWGYSPYASYYSIVTWQGQKAIKLLDYGPAFAAFGGSSIDREVDTWPLIAVKPGDVVVLKAWVWTEPSTLGDGSTYHGASIEIDPYSGNSRISAVNLRNGELVGTGTNNYQNGWANPQSTVPWGSGGWVQMSMTWTVPNTLQADGFGGFALGTEVTPTGFSAIIQGLSSSTGNEGAVIYIYGTSICINP